MGSLEILQASGCPYHNGNTSSAKLKARTLYRVHEIREAKASGMDLISYVRKFFPENGIEIIDDVGIFVQNLQEEEFGQAAAMFPCFDLETADTILIVLQDFWYAELAKVMESSWPTYRASLSTLLVGKVIDANTEENELPLYDIELFFGRGGFKFSEEIHRILFHEHPLPEPEIWPYLAHFGSYFSKNSNDESKGVLVRRETAYQYSPPGEDFNLFVWESFWVNALGTYLDNTLFLTREIIKIISLENLSTDWETFWEIFQNSEKEILGTMSKKRFFSKAFHRPSPKWDNVQRRLRLDNADKESMTNSIRHSHIGNPASIVKRQCPVHHAQNEQATGDPDVNIITDLGRIVIPYFKPAIEFELREKAV